MRFCDLVKEHRLTAGLSQKALADKVKVEPAYICDIEHGRKGPPPKERLELFTQAFKLSPAQKDQFLSVAFRERNLDELEKFEGVIPREASVLKDPGSQYNDSGIVRVPVFRTCPAGNKKWVSEDAECHEPISKSLIGSRRVFIIRVSGDSMDRAGLSDGTLVVVDADREPKNGDIVVARIDGEATIKRFLKSDHQITLVPDSNNPSHHPKTYTKANQIHICGVVEFIYLKKIK